MKKLWWCLVLALVGTALVTAGCQTHSGSREFLPSKGGWVPN